MSWCFLSFIKQMLCNSANGHIFGPSVVVFFIDTYICIRSLPTSYATNGKLNMTLIIFNLYVLAHTV